LRAALAAAERHDVWVLTRENNAPPLREFLQAHPLRDRIRIETLDVGGWPRRWKGRGTLGLHWYYDRWQRAAVERARALDRSIGFDVVHHVTFAAYWARAGVAALGRPTVIGPMGGGVEAPLGLIGEMGTMGVLADVARRVLRRGSALRPSIGAGYRAADVVIAQNDETLARLGAARLTRVFPHSTAVTIDALPDGDLRRTSDVVVVGRLISWKAPLLALRAFRHVTHPTARLRFFGRGPERGRVERAARRWGMGDRVVFEGPVSREGLLSHVRAAGVMLHPALHDESPLSVAEALSLGTPVVALDHGGPRQIVRQWPGSPATLVAAGRPSATARELAAAVDAFLAAPPPVPTTPTRPARSFADELAHAYELAVARRS
jgi:glycosyltransferase involved in cell wall biosynthesis